MYDKETEKITGQFETYACPIDIHFEEKGW